MTTTETAAKKDMPPMLGNPRGAFMNPGSESDSFARSSIGEDVAGASVIVVMGVSGTGKSTLGRALAGRLGFSFVDGDDLHPAANVAKMARGEPLEDGDRWAWLERVRERAVACVEGRAGERVGVVVACSALKKAYRAVLRGEGASVSTYFVFLRGEKEVLMTRMLHRQGHFMKASMLESQLDTLESPEGEPGVVTVSVEMSTEEQVKRVVEFLS